jgi:hypothetical protein
MLSLSKLFNNYRHWFRLFSCVGFITFSPFANESAIAATVSLFETNFNFNINLSGDPVQINSVTEDNNKNKSSIDVTYNETDKDFELIVQKNGNFNAENRKYNWVIDTGTLWKIRLNIIYTNGLIEDESTLGITGTALHNSKPRPPEHDHDEPQGRSFAIDFQTFNLETQLTDPGWVKNRIAFEKPDKAEHLPAHRDMYWQNSLIIDRDSNELEQLDSFKYELRGKHESVPEPLTILGAATAVCFGASFKRKLSESSEKDNIKDS